jgi:hypothetical protein
MRYLLKRGYPEIHGEATGGQRLAPGRSWRGSGWPLCGTFEATDRRTLMGESDTDA